MYSQIYNPTVKNTVNQTKKHYTQMTAQEMEFLKSKLQAVKPFLRASRHLNEKDNSVNAESVYKAIEGGNFEIIEYNEVSNFGSPEHRILIRDNQSYLSNFYGFMESVPHKELCNICAVICIDNGLIVTAYLNKRADNHRTIDQHRYCRSLQIIK